MKRDDNGSHLPIIVAALVIILFGINQAQSVVVLFLVSMFLAAIGTVPAHWMERKGIPPVVAVLIVVTAMVALLLSIGVVVGASLNNFSNSLPFYQTRMHDLLLHLKVLLASKGFSVTDEVLLGYVNPGAVMNFTVGLFTALSAAFSNVLLILFTVMFILFEAPGFPRKLRPVLDNPQATFAQGARLVNEIKRYIVIKTVINLVAGTLTALWLSVLGVDFPVLWGFLAFLLHFVPGVGSVVAFAPPVVLALVQLGGGVAALTAAGFVVIGTIMGSVVEPRIMGRRLGLSALVVFISLIFWGYLLGVVGALLCVPLTLTVKLACEAREDTQWIAVLLGPEIPPDGVPPSSTRKS